MLRVTILAGSLVAIGAFTGVSVAAGGPMADAGLDQTVTVETTVQLDGTGSGHPDGELSTYRWTIRTPDGREIETDCPDCERSQFTPSVVGRYQVNLTVTGPRGTQSTDTLYVYVQDAGPDVQLSGERTPDPNEAVTYTASAESEDAELEEIVWAVEDQVIAVRSLEGSSAENELSLAFSDAETHRVQVVVRDSNGRTAYDQLHVQPQSGSSSTSGWSDVDSSGCSDSGYAASHPKECWGLEESSNSSDDDQPEEQPIVGPEEVMYITEGYRGILKVGAAARDSNLMNRQVEKYGLDSGENAPWQQSQTERIIEPVTEEVSRFLFGQERKSVSCEMTVGERSKSSCGEKVWELENQGETTNIYSKGEAGSYSEYGLKNAERVAGGNPTSFEDGQTVHVKVVTQQQEEGIVDKTVEFVEPKVDNFRNTAGSVIEADKGGSSTSSHDDSSNNHRSSTGSNERGSGSSVSNTGGRIVSGTGSNSRGKSSSHSTETFSTISEPSTVNPRLGKGLVK